LLAERADGRLANVAGALIPGAATPPAAGEAHADARIARFLASLFEEVICVGSEPPADTGGRRVEQLDGPPGALRDIGSALAAATSERVLVVAAGAEEASPDLLLALVAWPEAEAVVSQARGTAAPSCGLYRREGALRAVREQFASGRNDVRAWLEALDTAYVDPEAGCDRDSGQPRVAAELRGGAQRRVVDQGVRQEHEPQAHQQRCAQVEVARGCARVAVPVVDEENDGQQPGGRPGGDGERMSIDHRVISAWRGASPPRA
jgi:molybdopterin-guanine dinucleotide biosynthesis protein A